MKDTSLKELKDMIIYVAELNKKELIKYTKIVNEIIESNITDEDIISRVFDQLLSLVFVDELLLKELYYKLLNYTKVFNEELSTDYEEIYKEQYEEEPITYKKANDVK